MYVCHRSRIVRDPKSQGGGIRHSLPVQAYARVGSQQRRSMVRRGRRAWQKGRRLQRVPGDVSRGRMMAVEAAESEAAAREQGRSMVRRRHREYRQAASHQLRPDWREQQEQRQRER